MQEVGQFLENENVPITAFGRVKVLDISVATIYNNLRVFKDIGIVKDKPIYNHIANIYRRFN
ncbi:transcriptional repressor [Staphylococcus epidermidis]|nr:transcriptional repressor [Staphylococcus epidermidis]